MLVSKSNHLALKYVRCLGSMRMADTSHRTDTIVELPHGARGTLNGCGFEMFKTSPLLATWVESYDGQHPLLDIGCAYGRNSAAAVLKLTERFDASRTTMVFASDPDEVYNRNMHDGTRIFIYEPTCLTGAFENCLLA